MSLKRFLTQCDNCSLFENPAECNFFRKEVKRVFGLNPDRMDIKGILKSNVDNTREAAHCVHGNKRR